VGPADGVSRPAKPALHTCRRWFGVAAGVLLASVAHGGDGGKIVVGRDVVVEGTIVRLRDVARLDGDAAEALADVELGPAPVAGESRMLDGRRVLDALVRGGLDASRVTYSVPPSIRVRRATQELTAASVRQLVEDELRRRLGADASGLVLRAVELPSPIRVPTGAWDAHLVLPPGAQLLGRTRVQLDVAVDGLPSRTAWLTLDVGRLADVVVATRPIAAGEVVGADALGLDRQDLSALPRDVVTDLAAVVGRTARTALVAYTPLRAAHVAASAAIKRGDTVQLVAERGPLRITALGEAKQDGAAGDRVSVVNRASGKVVMGRVLAANMVAVEF
jgi:flagellar basal body P-ring formation protein FlgA